MDIMTRFEKLIKSKDVTEFAKFVKDVYVEGVIDGTLECAQRALGKLSESEREDMRETLRGAIGYIDDTCLIDEMLSRLNAEQ
jgi:ethanolamine utilization cobalamin adenosyltransferase